MTTCSKCGASMECGAGTGSCWCADSVPIGRLPRSRACALRVLRPPRRHGRTLAQPSKLVRRATCPDQSPECARHAKPNQHETFPQLVPDEHADACEDGDDRYVPSGIRILQGADNHDVTLDASGVIPERWRSRVPFNGSVRLGRVFASTARSQMGEGLGNAHRYDRRLVNEALADQLVAVEAVSMARLQVATKRSLSGRPSGLTFSGIDQSFLASVHRLEEPVSCWHPVRHSARRRSPGLVRAGPKAAGRTSVDGRP